MRIEMTQAEKKSRLTKQKAPERDRHTERYAKVDK